MEEWFENVENLCSDNRIEFIRKGPDKVIFRCPKLPSKRLQDTLKKLIPDNIIPSFEEGPKSKTLYLIETHIRAFVASQGHVILAAHTYVDVKKLVINITAPDLNIEDDDIFFKNITDILIADGYFERWEFRNTEGLDYIFHLNIIQAKKKALSGIKPDRDTVITSDDILNLQIALNTAVTLDEFLEQI